MTFCYEYPHPAVASDIVLFTLIESKLSVLLIKRGLPPFEGRWAFPGGFLREDESIDACAVRELAEETHVTRAPLSQFGIYSDPKRDPRERVISVAFLSSVRASDVTLAAGTDANEAKWFDLGRLPSLAFDHKFIMKDALAELELRVRRHEALVANMLSKTFRLSELQEATEYILGTRLDKRNFRLRLREQEWLEDTGKELRGQHRPAPLYRVKR